MCVRGGGLVVRQWAEGRGHMAAGRLGPGDKRWEGRKAIQEQYGEELHLALADAVRLLPKAARVFEKLLDKDEPTRESLQAAIYVFNRSLGTPQTSMQIEDKGKGSVSITFVTRGSESPSPTETPKPTVEAIEGETRELPSGEESD